MVLLTSYGTEASDSFGENTVANGGLLSRNSIGLDVKPWFV